MRQADVSEIHRSRDRAALDGSLRVLDGFRLVFIHAGEDPREIIGDFLPHFGDEFDSFCGDSHHDFATVFGGMHALNVGQFFQTIDQAGSGCGRVAHLFSDVGHCQVFFARKVCQQEKLRERYVSFVEFV